VAIRKSDKTYLEALLELSYQFTDQLSGLLRDKTYPSAGPKDLLQCIIKASEILTTNIQTIITESAIGTIPVEDLLSQASDIYDFIDSFQSQILPIIRSSDSQSVPSELVRPFERIASSVFPTCKLMVSSVPENNYYFSEISPTINELFNSLKLDTVLNEFKMGSSDIFHLQLSNNPPCNILSHCLLGHEIGHAIYQKNDVEKAISPYIQFDDKVIKHTADSIFQSVMANLSSSAQPQQIGLQQTRESIEYLTKIQLPLITASWAEELFCDFVGVGLFGPAFICSLSILLLPFEDIDTPSDSYPPSRLRVQSCLTALNRNDPDNPGYGYKKLYESKRNNEYDSLIQPWKEAVGPRFLWPSDEPYKTAYNMIQKIKDKILLAAKQQLGQNIFTRAQFISEVPVLRKRLIDWLPPNEYQLKAGELFTISSLQAIFNAGWLSYLEDMPEFIKLFPNFTETQIRTKFYQLLIKGVDLANIQLKWNELSSTGVSHGDS
jgi:hypothetical protein